MQIDVEDSDTVAVLKSKIQSAQGIAISSQKIIYSGMHTIDPKPNSSLITIRLH
jgi:hypothetical protein